MNDNERFSDAALARIRDLASKAMGEKRYSHTLGVEKKAAEIAALFAPEQTQMLRAAALFHDFTKEWSTEKQVRFCRENGIGYGEERLAPKLFHSLTASVLVEKQFPEYADPRLLRAIRLHTGGAPDMTICDKILYLADYIEDTRTFPDCVELRRYYEEQIAAADTDAKRLDALDCVMLRSFDMTIRNILDENRYLAAGTVASRNALLFDIRKKEMKANG